MSIDPEHLAQLRASLERLQTRNDTDSLRQAVELLLRAAISHHESVGLGIPEEEVPPFMETGEPVAIPVAGGQSGG